MELTDINDRIDEAAIVPEKWPDLLQDLAGLADAAGGVLMGFSKTRPDAGSIVASERHQQLAEQFVSAGWGATNSRFAAGVRNGSAFEARFITEEDIFPAGHPFEQEELYRDLMIPAGLGRSIGTVFNHIHDDVIIVTFEREYARGEPSRQSRQLLDQLRPTLARATLLSYRVAFERLRGAVDILARLGLPAAAVKANRTAVVCNELFETREAVLTGPFGSVQLRDRRADSVLAEIISSLGTYGFPRSVPIRSPDGNVREVVHVVPVKRDARDVFSSADAIVILSAVGGDVQRAPVLQVLFDLTHREAAIANHLAAGRSLQQIAASTGNSVETVRNQLKSIFSKTGCSRQSELVHVIGGLFPGPGPF